MVTNEEKVAKEQEMREIERYSRQYAIIPKDNMDALKLIVIGVGVGGSWATYLCAKMGISNIDIYDFDKVEDANTPAQLFGLKDVGEFKVDALAKRILEDTGIEITAFNEKVDNTTYFDLNGNTIVLNLVDSIEVRKMIFDKIRGQPVKMIDARIGGEKGYQIYAVDMLDETECVRYEKTLEGSFVDMPCGTKAIIYASLDEVSQIVNIIKRIAVGEKYPKMINRVVTNFDAIVRW